MKVTNARGGLGRSPSFMERCSTLLKLNNSTDRKKRKKKLEKSTTSIDPRKRKRKSKGNKQQLALVEEEEKEEPTSIVVGDMINISDLLFTKNRDYLVKYNTNNDNDDHHLVKAKELVGKVLVIYFVPLSYRTASERLTTTHLIDVYNEITPKSGFEVVLVAIRDVVDDSPFYGNPLDPWRQQNPQERFNDIFSCMPWTAIPCWDQRSRIRLERRFGLSESSYGADSFIIDPTGKVLCCHAYSILQNYGAAEAFPFSDERMEILYSQDDAAAKQPSLTTLLVSPERDYVISNKREKVRICDLEDKVVGLYLYEEGFTDELTVKLEMAYKQLKKRHKNFEVVLVNLHFTWNTSTRANEDSFWKGFMTMPWLALPFKDPNCRKLARIFHYPMELGGPVPDPTLVIIGPGGKFVELFGADILMKFGVEAYPFTRKRVAKLEAERVQKLKLISLWDPEVVLRGKDGSQVQVSELTGKRILLYFEKDLSTRSTEFLTMLKERYLQKQGKADGFEVIHIILCNQESSYNKCVTDWPWLVCEDSSLAKNILYRVFYSNFFCCDISALVAFERDGRLVAKAWRSKFEVDEDIMDFPFAADLEKETLMDLFAVFNWDYYDD